MHHAFTSPKPEHADSVESDPGAVLADAYDVVCNGNEIGGGSIRIHRRDVQQQVFKVMGIDEAAANEIRIPVGRLQFRCTAARRAGVRLGPGGGVAGGVDSIREVIAFPKSGGGIDPLTDAPAPITAAQRKESGMDVPPQPR